MKISVVVPVHNEAENVESLIAEIHAALCGIETYEMIFVDDGSTDETSSILKLQMQHFAKLRILKHEFSYGQSRAIHSGVLAANYDWIVTLDGDGQNDPADISNLLNVLYDLHDNNLWMLVGYRYKRNDSLWRRLSSKVANSIRRFFLNDDTLDTGCGLKLFKRDKFLRLPYFDHMHRFLPALIQMTGGQVISVKVSHRPRQFGVSKYGTLDRLIAGIIDLFGVLWLKSRYSLVKMSEVSRG